MPVKFNQYWTIDQEKAHDYEHFMIHKFIPGINKLGIHTVAGWSVLIGGYSDIIFEGIANDLNLLEQALRDKKYETLVDDLQNYIKHYKTKVLVSTGTKESYTSHIPEKTVKFNQMWNIVSLKKSDYEKFVAEEFYPCMEDIGIHVADEWEVLIGDGPRIICEGRAQEIDKVTLINNLKKKPFQKAKHNLRQYIENYESRILIFHIKKILGYKTASYEMITY